MAPGLGNKRTQHLRALRVAQKLKREALAKEKEEALAKEKEEEYLPKELVARVDVVEEEPEKENDSDLDSDSEDSDEEDYEITDSEEQQEPVQVNISALDTLIASSQKHGAFDSTTFVYQRGPEPSEKTQLRKSQRERFSLVCLNQPLFSSL